MAANNYTVCPHCIHGEEMTKTVLEEQLEKVYGHVSKEEYEKLSKEFEKPIEMKKTLREDYTIGIEESWFEIEYHAHCSECNWEHTFSHQVAVN